MGNVLAILKRDFKRLLKVPSAWVVAIGLVLIPPMYAWFNIRGFWNPYKNTSGIEVTVVNNDEGTTNTLVGKTNLGLQIVNRLKDNTQLGWNFADEQEGMERVLSGESYATIVIPKTFSKDLLGVITGSGKQPELKYYVNEKASAIAPKITDTGASTVDNQVNSTFVSTVSEVLSKAVNTLDGEITDKAGSMQTSAVSSLTEARGTISSTRTKLVSLIADMDGTPYDKADLKGALVLVIGSEGHGMTRLVKEQCDFIVSLPMVGRINSLNASVAGSILMYEALRQRTAAK